MYCFSTSFFIGQYVWYDTFHITMTDYNGNPILQTIQNRTEIDRVNQLTGNILHADFSNIVQNVTSAAFVAWNLLQILTGVYIFNILLVFAIPQVAVFAISVLYYILIGRMIIAYVRSI